MAIACGHTAERGAYSSVLGAIDTAGERVVFGIFLIMLLTGLLYGIKLVRAKD